MNKFLILLFLVVIIVNGNTAEKAISLYNAGKYKDARAIAEKLDEAKAKNLYVKGITETVGNEAASYYRKALASDDITNDLSKLIYQRLAGYYDAVGIPGSVTVMLDRATMTVTKAKTGSVKDLDVKVDSVEESKADSVISSKKDPDTVQVVEKSVEKNKSTVEDTLDFASIEDTAVKESEPKASVAKSMVVSSGPKVFYVLQTGAFGLESNALNMKTNLEKSFRDVTVKKQKSGDRTLYKVRVGHFSSQQEALDYASARLRPKKIKFRIVKE